jgi:DNA-binding MarR family transcriptional regulator
MEPAGSNVGARARSKRTAQPRRERPAGAKVDLGILPRMLGYNLRRAHQLSWRTYVSFIGESKIRPGLFSLLVLTRANPGIAQIELGTHLGVDKASIVALLDRLERAGLIERRRSTRDRRRQGIFLTEAGSTELEALMGQVRQLERQMASRFTKAELDQFLDFLRRMHA